jgi:hypothetical protein
VRYQNRVEVAKELYRLFEPPLVRLKVVSIEGRSVDGLSSAYSEVVR